MFLADTYTCLILGPLVQYPCFEFQVMSPLGFKARVGSALFTFVEVNVKYIPRDPPLVLHMLTSWQPSLQPVTFPHV